MSYKIIQSAIIRFLKSDEPEVIAIRGAWGVGKTYTLNDVLNKNKQNISFKKYSYVSLFGIDNIESLKNTIFQNTIDRDLIGTNPSLESFSNNFQGVGKSWINKIWGKAGKIDYSLLNIPALGSLINSISSFLTTKTIICIDDFERKGENISLKSIFSLVSMLREQKNCKIVLIFNDEKFDTNDFEEYKSFKEKVIDIELLFDITPEECTRIILNENEYVGQKTIELSNILRIKNMRILKKIDRLSAILSENLVKYDTSILDSALHSLVLYTWCFYSKDDAVPDFDFVKNIESVLIGIPTEKKTNSKEEGWEALMRKYNYLMTSDFDLVIASLVERGYCDNELLVKEAEKLREQKKDDSIIESIRVAWKTYHDSFDDDENNVINTLESNFRLHYMHYTPLNLNGLISLFRDVGQENLANKCIDYYIDNRKNECYLFDLKNQAFGNEIKDEEIIRKFDEAFKKYTKIRPLRELLLHISKTSSWSKEDLLQLENTSEDDFYALFKSEKGDDLSKIVDGSLIFRNMIQTDTQYKAIYLSVENALKKIGNESKLNKRRVSKFGIIVNNL